MIEAEEITYAWHDKKVDDLTREEAIEALKCIGGDYARAVRSSKYWRRMYEAKMREIPGPAPLILGT